MPRPSLSTLEKQRQKIARLIRGKEEALLERALLKWKGEFAAFDEAPEQTSDDWVRAACHNGDLGVLSILQRAGIRPSSWTPLGEALLRGHDDLALAIAQLHSSLPLPGAARRRKDHVLVEAAKRGRVDILSTLLDGSPETPTGLAQWLLLSLARGETPCTQEALDTTVGYLVEQGADPNAGDREGQTAWQRSPVAYHAAAAGNVKLLMALHAHGADLRLEQTTEAYMPHPYANAQMAVVQHIGDTYYKLHRITDEQWECMHYLADMGVLLDPQGEADLMRRLPGNVPPWERAKLMDVARRARIVLECEALDRATPPSLTAGSRARL